MHGFKQFVKKTIALSAALLMTASLCSCKDNDNADKGQSTVSSDETVSLEPITVFFPESYILFKPLSGDSPEINVKGNTAITLTEDKTVQFDPNTYESLTYSAKYESVGGVSAGVGFEKLASVYGLVHGTCVALNSKNEAVSVGSIGADSPEVTVLALIELKADGTVEYLAPSRVAETVDGFRSGGAGYRAEASVGDDFLIIEAKLARDAVVDELTVTHYTF